jgi:uncharacterized RDD family membrane protein YckC
MADKYCDKCSARLMPTMRVCPSCGCRTFSQTPPPTQPSFATATNTNTTQPSSTIMPQPASVQFIPAGHWQRIGAAMIDAMIVAVISGIPIAIGYLFTFSRKTESGINIITVAMILISIVAPYCYFTILHSSARRATYGKVAMGLILVTAQGETLTKVQALVRVVLTALIPVSGLILLGLSAAGIAMQYKDELQSSLAIAIGIGILAIYFGPFATVYFNPKRQTLFDLICKTYVIKNTTP